MFTIHMHPAHHGDCLWVEYGPKKNPYRILIDGGTGPTMGSLRDSIEALPPAKRHFDLLVITHVDDDHIGGALKLLEELEDLKVRIDHVWFNAYAHLEGKAIVSDDDLLGAKQGERLSELIVERKLPWNKHFEGRAIVCEDDKPLPLIDLPGGMRLTLLSPYWTQLDKLKSAWIAECKKAKIIPGVGVSDDLIDDTLGENVDTLAKLPFESDDKPANGSSIAFLADYRGKKVLFGADAHVPVLLASLETLGYSADDTLQLDAMKVPHHGSKKNISRELLQVTRSSHLLISTNGAQFSHPDLPAIARMVVFNAPDATLHFNYRTKHNEFWFDEKRQQKYKYAANHPAGDESKIVLDLS